MVIYFGNPGEFNGTSYQEDNCFPVTVLKSLLGDKSFPVEKRFKQRGDFAEIYWAMFNEFRQIQ